MTVKIKRNDIQQAQQVGNIVEIIQEWTETIADGATFKSSDITNITDYHDITLITTPFANTKREIRPKYKNSNTHSIIELSTEKIEYINSTKECLIKITNNRGEEQEYEIALLGRRN